MTRLRPTRGDQIPLRNGRLLTLAEFNPHGSRPVEDITLYHMIADAMRNLGLLGEDGLTLVKPGRQTLEAG